MRVPRFLIQVEGEFPAFMTVPRFLIQPGGEFPAFIRPILAAAAAYSPGVSRPSFV
jgi:hypothetical protein